jgi:DNA-binding transcriptional LysR family regulator
MPATSRRGPRAICYPQLSVELVTEAAMVDIVGHGFDAGVRLEEFVPPDMIAVPITRPIRSLVVGSPAYFAERKRPKTPADLTDHRCIRRRTGSGTSAAHPKETRHAY